MRILKREIKVFEDFDDQILEDYVKNTYNDVKQNEDKDNAEIIEEFEAIKKEELDGDSFS
jgi:DNA-binding protein YbaB|tara:strand:- start:2100 stop:2279 length:180 start_codon:yes stop_codon:yes gene_type:complete